MGKAVCSKNRYLQCLKEETISSLQKLLHKKQAWPWFKHLFQGTYLLYKYVHPYKMHCL